MTTFTDRLAGEGRRNLRQFVTIEGVDEVFCDEDVPDALLTSTRTRVPCIQALTQDRRELDMVERRAKGGGIRLRLQDDADHTLRALFSMRKRRTTYISANVSSSATTITVKSTSAFAAAGDFWCGAECISYTGKTSTTFTGCTRGAYGTTARAMRGGSTNGQAVYDAPPSWIGRKITLKGYFVDAASSDAVVTGTDTTVTETFETNWTIPLEEGITDAAAVVAVTTTADTLGTFEVDSPPQYLGDDSWEISGLDRIDNYLKRAIHSGVENKNVSAGRLRVYQVLTPGDDQGASIYMTDEAMIGLFGTATVGATLGDHAFILLDIAAASSYVDNDGIMIMRATSIESTTSSDGRHKVFLNPEIDLNRHFDRNIGERSSIGASGGSEGPPEYLISDARAVVYLREKADTLALKVLTSDDGDGGNGTSDVLRGRDTSAVSDTGVDVIGWRIGANIKQADIDTASLATVGQSVDWFYFVAEPTTVGDFMRDFCLATESFMLTNLSGSLSVKSMTDGPSSISSMTIDASQVIGKAKCTYDESNVFPRVIFKYGYDPIAQDFTAHQELQDSELIERYPSNDATLTIESKSIYGHVRSLPWLRVPITPAGDIQRMARRYQCEEAGRGALHVEVTVHLDAALLNLGDIVTLTLDDVPDMEGSTISARRARVVSHCTNWQEGTVELRLQLLRPPKRISPAAIISSTASADTVLTLSASPPEAGAVAGSMFGVGSNVIVWDVSGNVSHTTTLTAATATTVTLAAAPAFAIQATVDFITMGAADVADTDVTQNGFTPLTDFIFQVNDDEREFESGVPLAGESRWR